MNIGESIFIKFPQFCKSMATVCKVAEQRHGSVQWTACFKWKINITQWLKVSILGVAALLGDCMAFPEDQLS